MEPTKPQGSLVEVFFSGSALDNLLVKFLSKLDDNNGEETGINYVQQGD